jgi:four helix bundle protein
MPTETKATGHPYERLQAWAACHELVIAIYRATLTWPKTEQYGLISQVRRAAFSASANICEGSMRRGSKEFRRFLDISLGSLAELSYTLRLAADLGYLDPAKATELEIARDHAGRVTWGLYRAICRSADGKKKPE